MKDEHLHDYENAKRVGRAHYICPECGKDITLELVMMAEGADQGSLTSPVNIGGKYARTTIA